MSMARLVITAVVVEGRSKSEVARTTRCRARWVQTLVPLPAEGEAARAPVATTYSVLSGSTTSRTRSSGGARSSSSVGLDAGADTIVWHLPAAMGQDAGRLDDLAGVVPARVRPRSRTSGPTARRAGSRPSSPTNAGRPTSPTGVSRTAPTSRSSTSSTTTPACSSASDARLTFKSRRRPRTFHDAATAGVPASMLTDNGAVFTGRPPRRTSSALELGSRLGIAFHHSRPYHPQTCGRSNASTRPRRSGSPNSPPPDSPLSSSPALPVPPATTTPTGPTGRSSRRTPRSRPTPPAPRPHPTRRLLIDRSLPGPPRPRRHRRHRHPALPQPPPPHRPRPTPQRRNASSCFTPPTLDMRVINRDRRVTPALTIDPTKTYKRRNGSGHTANDVRMSRENRPGRLATPQ